MDDARIVALYWDRSDEAIPETASKYDSYLTSISQNILEAGRMLRSVSTTPTTTRGTPCRLTALPFSRLS